MDPCVFKECKKPQVKYGACEGHQDMARAVMRAAPVTCVHGVALDKECFDCASAAARRRAFDATVVDAARAGKVTDAMKLVDLYLRELHRTLLRRAFDSVLGPAGGEPIATHIGLPMGDGRVYSIRYEEGAFHAYWGTVRAVSSTEADAIVLYFEGVRQRMLGEKR